MSLSTDGLGVRGTRVVRAIGATFVIAILQRPEVFAAKAELVEEEVSIANSLI